MTSAIARPPNTGTRCALARAQPACRRLPSPDDATRYAIAARGLTKSFKAGTQKVEVLRGIDLLIEPGEIALVMGPSGSGKSTLLAAVSGLLRPDEGTVTALGEDLWKPAQGQDRQVPAGELRLHLPGLQPVPGADRAAAGRAGAAVHEDAARRR